MESKTFKIEEVILSSLNAFHENWDKYLAINPSLKLNYLWPSIGVLDLITFGFRGSPPLSGEQGDVFKGVLAYISKFVCEVWAKANCKVELFVDPDYGMVIKAEIEGKSLLFQVQRTLTSIFRECPSPLPLTSEFYRPYSVDANIVSPLVLSFVMGLHPSLNISWDDDSQRDQFIAKVEKVLSFQTAKWFEETDPKSPLSHLPELYLNGLIFPMFMMEEGFPLTKRLVKLADYLSSIGANREVVSLLASSFSKCPDEIISFSAVPLYLSTFSNRDGINRNLLACSRSKGDFVGLLRDSLEKLSKKQGIEWNWLETKFTNLNSVQQFELESEFGFMPWVTLTSQNVLALKDDHRVWQLLFSLLEYNLPESILKLDSLIEDDPSNIDLRVQRIKLCLVNGEVQEAHELCRRLITEPKADSNPRFFNVWGYCLLELKEPEGAARYFKAGLSLKKIEPSLKAEMLNNLAWSLILLEQYEDAKPLLDEAISLSLSPVTAMLNKTFICWQERKMEEALNLRKQLFSISPLDRRVFAGIRLFPAI